MRNATDLPVAILVPIENITGEIETVNPVNNRGHIIASIATIEYINDEPDVETAIPVITSPTSNHENHIDNFVETVITNNPVSLINDRRNITLFVKTRKRGLICYTPILLIQLLHIFVNPLAIVFLLNMVYNLFTLINCDIKLIKTNIITNIASIVIIILSDIFFVFNIDTLLFYFIKKEFNEKKIELYYLITLYVTSIIVIITYLYLTFILNKLRIFYNNFSQYQINLLKAILKHM